MNNTDDDAMPGDGEELDPTLKPKSSAGWLKKIVDAETVFRDWQERSDSIDKLYANLSNMASVARSREFQLFWANVEVLKPSIYARPPVPVVTTKFKDRRPLYRAASEMLERCCIVAFDMTDIDGVMRLLRDDVAVVARGTPWVRYETKQESDTETERAVVEHKDRKDFLHDPARKWPEVGWVSGAGHMTKKEMRKRFFSTSGNAYLQASYSVQKESRELGGANNQAKAKVWEIWSKTENKVVWVTEGCDVVLDEGEPHLKLEGFFPCPMPAYATVQRGSLIPVPDMVFYKDQLEEINELTGRIHALSQAVQVRGFYPAGASDVGDAIESAIKSNDSRRTLIPVANWAAFGGTAPKDTIVWLPIEMIVTTIQSLVELRRQIIEDVYQIMGLSDIMRGATDPKETLGAQQLKSQYGSVRVRGKQAELVRVSRDLVRIVAEIMAENFSKETLEKMSQTDLPKEADIARQVKDLEAQELALAKQVKQAIAENPEAQEQIMQQAEGQVSQIQQQLNDLKGKVTVEACIKFLKDQKIRPFTLDIETDSTIQPDEDAEKQRRNEFMTSMGAVLPQLGQMIAQEPASAPFAGELLKFVTSAFRPGRGMDEAIDEFVDSMKEKAKQPRPNPEAEQAKAENEREDKRLQAELQKTQMEGQSKQAETATKAQAEQQKAMIAQQAADHDADLRQQESQVKLTMLAAQMDQDQRRGDLEMQKMHTEMQFKREEMEMKREAHQMDLAMKARTAEIQATAADQKAEHNAQAFEQKSALTEQQAAAKEQSMGAP